VALYGLVQLLIGYRAYGARHEFAVSYLEKLKAYWESGGADSEAYGWLIHRSNKMQREMGDQGIIDQYRPPHEKYMIRNYPIILNMLPDLRRSLEDDLLARRLAPEYLNAIEESIFRYLGSLEDSQQTLRNDLKNPVKWFRRGVGDVVALPLYLAGWLGAFPDKVVGSWTGSPPFSLLSGLLALVGFASGIMTIVLGWEQFIEAVKGLWS